MSTIRLLFACLFIGPNAIFLFMHSFLFRLDTSDVTLVTPTLLAAYLEYCQV